MAKSGNFCERTDRLAARRRVTLSQLAKALGTSQASLYGYRAGNRSIPRRIWMRVEELENEMGAGYPPPRPELPQGVREVDNTREEMINLRLRVQRLERLIERFARDVLTDDKSDYDI